MKQQNAAIGMALLINLVLFTLFFSFYYPIYNSKEDVFAAYLLSGGFGDAPTNFLHYNYGLHPYLTWVVKELFAAWKNINWYSWILIAAHFIACSIVLWLLLRRGIKLLSLLLYIAFFLVFEGSFLIIPDFTGTSIVLAAVACAYWLNMAKENNRSRYHAIVIVALLLLASFFRIHTMLPVIGLALPFGLWWGCRQTKIRSMAILFAAVIAIVFFNWLHQVNYAAKEPNWHTEEKTRDRIYRLYDYHADALYHVQPGEKWYPECQLLTRGLICDSVLFAPARMDSLYHHLTTMRLPRPPLPGNWLKWFWINNRLFFCLLLFLILVYGLARPVRFPLLLSLLCLTGGTVFLLYTAKLPSYVFTGCLYMISLAVLIPQETTSFMTRNRYTMMVASSMAALFIAWGIIRQHKTSITNKGDNNLFKLVYAEVSRHPGKLFIVTENFPIHNFYAFDLPTAFPLSNYLDTEHFLMNIYYPVLHKFGLQRFTDIPASGKVYFWGKPVNALQIYFREATGKNVLLSEPASGFQFGEVREYSMQ